MDKAYIAPLFFMEFTNSDSTFVSLIDNGSQLNVIDAAVLPFLEHQEVLSPSKITSFQGAQGKRSPIKKWIRFDITLSNGRRIPTIAAVVKPLPCSIILGQPFLITNKGQLDHRNKILTLKQGIVKLRESFHLIDLTSNAVIAEIKGMNLIDTNITTSQTESLHELLTNYQALWADNRIGRAKHMEHRIRLNKEKPIVEKSRHFTQEQTVEIGKQVEKMLEDGIIKPSNSPFSSEIGIAKKKDADGNFTGWRFCIDFRKINTVTIQDEYPLPRIPDLVHAIKESKYFIALDLKAGYWQIPMEEESIKYTAFRCIKGLYEFAVIPFGLTNAARTFQRLVDFLFGDLRNNGTLVYQDDILIHGKTFEEVMGRLRIRSTSS